jgi:hypothetical protein
MHYRLGGLDLSTGARLMGYTSLSADGKARLNVQPMAGAAMRLRRGLAVELTGQPFRMRQDALPLPLPSQSYGGLYSLGIVWRMEK